MKAQRIHYADLGYPIPENAAMATGCVQQFGCSTANARDARGISVRASCFRREVTCADCLRYILKQEAQT